jgi:uncharacterized protein YyaL (SSP411 family)
VSGADGGSSSRRPNGLAGETSPYLLQHLYNPVDWQPWGEAALERARREDRPIFLSIGYAACHWCHVMERESFEDEAIARTLNERFVPIKVDREERPDIDEIYMSAVQLMTGQGGWPLNVFLTPDLQPFFGGTYFPPEQRYGRISFGELLDRLIEAWDTRRDDVARSAEELTARIRTIAAGAATSGTERVGRSEIVRACSELAARFDDRWGGFGAAPKFPPDGALALLLDEHARSGECIPLEMATRTRDALANGGMYDHVGGGFSRYSDDERWLVPHFEKMLYNQATLVPIYTDAWTITGNPAYRRVVLETLDFVRDELTDEHGGFHSSLDADSEGVEGKFYVWTPDEIRGALGATETELFSTVYGVTPEGNFEGSNIPNLLEGNLAARAAERDTTEDDLVATLAPMRKTLLEARARRVRPGTDDKVLTAWNGLMLTGFARAYQTFGRDEDLRSALRAAEFAEATLLDGDRLRVSYREGNAKLNGYLDDYVFLARGCLDLYEACFDRRWLDLAARLARTTLERFEDPDRGGFYFVSDDHEELLTRTRSLHDGALPSGAGVATEILGRLAIHLGDDAFRAAAERTLVSMRGAVSHMPSAYASLLLASTHLDDRPPEVAILGAPDDERTRALLATVRGRYLGRPAVQLADPSGDAPSTPLLEGKSAVEGKPTAYVCRDYACLQPTTDPDELSTLLDRGPSVR